MDGAELPGTEFFRAVPGVGAVLVFRGLGGLRRRLTAAQGEQLRGGRGKVPAVEPIHLPHGGPPSVDGPGF